MATDLFEIGQRGFSAVIPIHIGERDEVEIREHFIEHIFEVSNNLFDALDRKFGPSAGSQGGPCNRRVNRDKSSIPGGSHSQSDVGGGYTDARPKFEHVSWGHRPGQVIEQSALLRVSGGPSHQIHLRGVRRRRHGGGLAHGSAVAEKCAAIVVYLSEALCGSTESPGYEVAECLTHPLRQLPGRLVSGDPGLSRLRNGSPVEVWHRARVPPVSAESQFRSLGLGSGPRVVKSVGPHRVVPPEGAVRMRSFAVCLALMLAVAVNLTDFIVIEANHRPAAALQVNRFGPNLQVVTAEAGGEPVREWFLLPSAIWLTTGGGARVTGFTDAPLRLYSLFGFGGISSYDIGDHDPWLTAEQVRRIDEWIRFEGEDETTGRFAVAALDTRASHLLVYRHDRLMFVDARLIALLDDS